MDLKPGSRVVKYYDTSKITVFESTEQAAEMLSEKLKEVNGGMVTVSVEEMIEMLSNTLTFTDTVKNYIFHEILRLKVVV